MAEKQYGLIKPQKPYTRLLAFASDSDSDDEPAKKKISIGESSSQKRQARIIHADALKEDPTIFQYDEVYDEMSATREEAKKAKTSEVRQSKYISKLLVTAEKRKLEYESRLERKVQKERDAEGDQFKDKGVFLTAAYRGKLEALKKAEADAQREECLESIGDVRKQNDLRGFYRHVYEQRMGGKQEVKPTEPVEAEKSEVPQIKKKDDKFDKRRTYRTKHSNHEDSDDDNEQKTTHSTKTISEPASKKVHLQSNLDADSDFSIDSYSDSDSDAENKDEKKEVQKEIKSETAPQKLKMKTDEKLDKQEEKLDTVETEEKNGTAKPDTTNDVKDVKFDEKEDKEAMPPPKEVKQKIDIWKKRTVGDVYLEAVKRYYERKQATA